MAVLSIGLTPISPIIEVVPVVETPDFERITKSPAVLRFTVACALPVEVEGITGVAGIEGVEGIDGVVDEGTEGVEDDGADGVPDEGIYHQIIIPAFILVLLRGWRPA
ncbi:MAG: hypothetical protein WA139_04110 [Candidatus Aenigmatarchaeota archaeon]